MISSTWMLVCEVPLQSFHSLSSPIAAAPMLASWLYQCLLSSPFLLSTVMYVMICIARVITSVRDFGKQGHLSYSLFEMLPKAFRNKE